MVLHVLFALLIIGIIAALAIMAIIYVPLLPLFVQVWFVELFGDVNARTALPLLTLVLGFGSLLYLQRVDGKAEMPKIEGSGVQGMVLGLVLALIGAYVFGSTWEILQLQSAYYSSVDAFNPPPCVDTATLCLIESSPGYGTQYPKALVAAILWYLGAYFWLNELDEVEWVSNTDFDQYEKLWQERSR